MNEHKQQEQQRHQEEAEQNIGEEWGVGGWVEHVFTDINNQNHMMSANCVITTKYAKNKSKNKNKKRSRRRRSDKLTDK